MASFNPSIPEPLIYRRFFLAAMVIGLVAGAAGGTFMLVRIGLAGSYTGVPIHEVNAHGHAQVFGWFGLLSVGIAYQLLPRLWQTRLIVPRLAKAVFLAMVIGVVLRTVAMAWPGFGWAMPAMLLGGLLQLLAVLAFAGQMLVTAARSGVPLTPAAAFVLVAIGWFVLATVASIWHTWAIMTATTRHDLLAHVMVYQAPLRDLQLRGLALFMLLGLSLYLLPAMFGVPRTSARRAWAALGMLTMAVGAMVVLFIAYQRTGTAIYVRALLGTWLMLAIGVAIVAWPWRLWRLMPQWDRTAKFVRMAYLWLMISLVMLALLPIHQVLSGIGFSHAYYGAIRHAMTVGFVSMMLMGIAARLVPLFQGLDSRSLTPLWGPFILVNVGCGLRVGCQVLTDWHSGAFLWVSVSGFMELVALTWWSVHLVMFMYFGHRQKARGSIHAIAQEHHAGPPALGMRAAIERRGHH